MKSILFAIGLFCLSVTTTYAQALYVPEGSTVYVGNNASLYTGGNTLLQGHWANYGKVKFNASVNFMTNTKTGSIELGGNNDSYITGGQIEVDKIDINTSGSVTLNADSTTITQQLLLTSGNLRVDKRTKVLSNSIEGGSEQSFIEGNLHIQNNTWADLFFPIGTNGMYQPVTLHNVPEGLASIEALIPDPKTLVPGDSLIGLADEMAWKVSFFGKEKLKSKVTIQPTGIDLNDFPVSNPIRSNKYVPTIATLSDNATFKSLEAGAGSDETITAPTRLVSSQNITLDNTSTLLAIGVAPITDHLQFYVPTVFTPNGSLPENKVFRAFLRGSMIFNAQLTIWDKFNSVVFSQSVDNTKLENTGWHGRYSNGADAPEGIYYYSIRVHCMAGIFEKKGTVLLAR